MTAWEKQKEASKREWCEIVCALTRRTFWPCGMPMFAVWMLPTTPGPARYCWLAEEGNVMGSAVYTVSYVLFTSVVAGSTIRFSPCTVVDVCGGGGVAIANNSGNRSSTKNNNWMLKSLQSSFSPTTKSQNEIGLCPTNKTWEFCEELQHKQKTNSDLRHDDNCRSQGYIFVTDS